MTVKACEDKIITTQIQSHRYRVIPCEWYKADTSHQQSQSQSHIGVVWVTPKNRDPKDPVIVKAPGWFCCIAGAEHHSLRRWKEYLYTYF